MRDHRRGDPNVPRKGLTSLIEEAMGKKAYRGDKDDEPAREVVIDDETEMA